MKLKIGDKVYLQKYELVHILHEPNSFPASFMEEAFGDGIFIMSSPADGFRFECLYKDPRNVEWLMEQDWIVDHDEYAEMSLDELEVLCEHLIAEYSASIEEFNAKDEAYREAHFDEKSDKFDKLRHKIISLKYIAEFLKGKVEFVFPDGYQCKTATISSTTSTTKKKPSFFARLFGRGAQ